MTKSRVELGEGSPRVFLSHAAGDEAQVRAVAAILSDYGIRSWLFEDQLLIGESIVEGVASALQEADFIVFFVSRLSISSEWVRTEVAEALWAQHASGESKLLPVKLDDSEVPALLRHRIHLDLSGAALAEGAHRLARSIVQRIMKVNRRRTFIDTSKEQIVELASRRNCDGFHWVIISGPSCSGKDVLAHVLEQQLLLPKPLRWASKITTRPPRQSEPDYVKGVMDPEFAHLEADGRLLFPYSKRSCRYAFVKEEFERAIAEGVPLLSVFTEFRRVPEIAIMMEDVGLPVTPVFVEAHKDHLLRRVLFRNLPPEEIASRVRSIERDFLEMKTRRRFREEYTFVENGDDRAFVDAAVEMINIVRMKLTAG